jgi:hypothetical protein
MPPPENASKTRCWRSSGFSAGRWNVYVVVASKRSIRGLTGRVAQPARAKTVSSAANAKKEPSRRSLAGPSSTALPGVRREPQECRVATDDRPRAIFENGLL